MFVGIDLGVKEDEQQIFDTINSLGVRLTTAELLKNYFFNRNGLKEYKKYWKDIFEISDDIKNYWDKEITTGGRKRTFIDIFFYSYLQIKIQENDINVKAEDKVEFSKLEILFESYKKLIKDYNLDKKKLLKEIKIYADIFYANFNLEIVEQELTPQYGIDRINAIIFGLENSTLISYVLYILKNVTSKQVRNELFEFLESYILRRMVVRATTKNYTKLFADSLIANKILTKKAFQDYLRSRSDKSNYFPNDEDLKNGFNSSPLTNKKSKGVIYMIESRTRNRKKHGTSLLGINKYSLEHLMPKKWENKWSNISTKEEKDFRNFKLKTLGNLAIITQSLNASIRDSDWDTKKQGNGKRLGLESYSAGIETLSPFLKLEEWNEIEIQKRADYLFGKAKEIWKSDDL